MIDSEGKRLNELEARATFQEDTIEKLSKELSIQQKEIVLLKEELKSLKEFFSNKKNEKVVSSLTKHLKIENSKTNNKDGKLSGKTIMFTGGFEKISRSEAKSLVEENGGKVLGNISSKLNILVIGNSKPTKSKIEKAKELQVKIISEKNWYKLLNI